MYILSSEQGKALDKRTIEELGLPGFVLMETAGRGVTQAILRRTGPGAGRLATVLCGVGNNGGDGFVIARELHYRGFRVHVWIAGKSERMSEETALHYRVMRKAGLSGRFFDGRPKPGDLKGLHRSLLRSAVIVDALMGIGGTQELRDPVRTLVEQLDGRHEALVVGVDMPSGVCADDGRILGAAAHCDLVVTMVAAKAGLFLGEGANRTGDVEVVDIGVPPEWIAAEPGIGRLLTPEVAAGMLPSVDEEAHKHQMGHLLVVAGAPSTSGAALLCASAAMRSGAGLCTLATAGEIRTRLESQVPDLMIEAIRGGHSEAKRVAKIVEDRDALAVGPGMGTNAAAIDLVMRLLSSSTVPVVLDADGLTNLAAKPDAADPAANRLVLTPHPGEMARLLDKTTEEVLADPLGAAHAAAVRFSAVVVLKGARTLVVHPDGRWAVRCQPNAALAKAGSGDVLCGVIGALLARGLAPFEAACLGVVAHSEAGLRVRATRGTIGAMTSDLLTELPAVWVDLQGRTPPQAPAPPRRPKRDRGERRGRRADADDQTAGGTGGDEEEDRGEGEDR